MGRARKKRTRKPSKTGRKNRMRRSLRSSRKQWDLPATSLCGHLLHMAASRSGLVLTPSFVLKSQTNVHSRELLIAIRLKDKCRDWFWEW